MILSSVFVNSQTITTISGKVVSKNTKEEVPFATVAVLSENDSLVAGNFTSADGSFIIEGLEKGKYTVSISYFGYKSYSAEVLIGELLSNYDLGKIMIVPSSTEWEEATISGNRYVINSQMDKKTFYMNNYIAQTGGSVLDAMKAIPGINFDQDGDVVLSGSDKVIVLIDGKQSSLSGFRNQKDLNNIPAANVRSIEIMNNPSAKYDPSGMAGIININYTKNVQYSGLQGSVGFAYAMGLITGAKADLPSDLGSYSLMPKFLPGFDLNFTGEKVSVYMESEVKLQQTLPGNEFTSRYYDDGRIIASQVPHNRKQQQYVVKGGVEYRIDENNTLTFSGTYDWENHLDSAQVPYLNMLRYARDRFISWKDQGNSGYLNYALNYEYKFKQVGHNLSANFQYTKGREEETYYINDSSDIRPKGRDITSIYGEENITRLSLDYTKPFRTGRFEGGTNLQVRNLPLEYTQDRGENSILYPGLGSWTDWKESVYSGYFKWIHEKKRYAVEAGLSPEYAKVFYGIDPANTYYPKDDAYDYLKLFPALQISFKINQNNKLSASYNQRIDRPGEKNLRIFPKSDDHEIVSMGNPYLRPQFTQLYELGYLSRWKSGSVYLSAYFDLIEDMYLDVYTQDNSRPEYDVILKNFTNAGQAIDRGLEIAFSQNLFKFWKLSGKVRYFQMRFFNYQGTLLFPYEHTFNVDGAVDNSWDANLFSTFILSENSEFQISALYMAPKSIPLGRQLWRSSVDISFIKKIWDGRAELSLAATDLFNNYGIRQEYNGDGFKLTYENYYETQVIRVGFKYIF